MISVRVPPFHTSGAVLGTFVLPAGSRKLPASSSTLPSGRLVAVGYHRPWIITELGVHVLLTGSYTVVWSRPAPSAR